MISENPLMQRPLEFHFLSLFPELFQAVLKSSVLGKAQEKGLVSFHFTQIRDFTHDKHRVADDSPYGGGAGMLLKVDVLYAAWQSVMALPEVRSGSLGSHQSVLKPLTILLSPQGPLFTQEKAHEIIQNYSKIIFVCGHYEGVDERFIQLCVDQELSIGHYVLTGGELPALIVADTLIRLVPGVIGNPHSISEESLENHLLKYPQYTRPSEFMGLPVPPVLLSGNHQAIAKWRQEEAYKRTQQKRPDLFKNNKR